MNGRESLVGYRGIEEGSRLVLAMIRNEGLSPYLNRSIQSLDMRILYTKDLPNAYRFIKGGDIGLVLVELSLISPNAIEILKKIKSADSPPRVIMLADESSANLAMEAFRNGADDILFNDQEFENRLRKSIQTLHPQVNRAHAEPNRSKVDLPDLVGNSHVMKRMTARLEKVAGSTAPVLITGETGTGKEVIARAIHRLSGRADKVYIPLDCGAISASLMDSELFGHVKGAFTGAVGNSTGMIRAAEGGTLFLDEIGEFPLELQSKLLRFLQEKEVRPVGGTQYRKVDVRVLAATNRNLQEMVQQGTFRKDLYFRLSIVTLELPPLRDRLDDIPDLIHYFLEKHGTSQQSLPTLSFEVIKQFMSHPWSGNVRELENTVLKIMALGMGEAIDLARLHEILEDGQRVIIQPTPEETPPVDTNPTTFPLSLQGYEKMAVERALKSTQWNIEKASNLLGVSRSTLYRKVKEHHLDVRDAMSEVKRISEEIRV